MSILLTITSNRTKVELKPCRTVKFLSKAALPIEPKWNWNMLKFKLNSLFKIFQSNQSGIETCYYLSVQNISSPFQSNQSGIETCCQKKKPNNLKASNRTKVELKLWFQNTIRFTTFSLPIEPKWNWNGVFFFCMKIFPCFQSNQSGIETSDEYFFTKAAFLPIEPKWNWNYCYY